MNKLYLILAFLMTGIFYGNAQFYKGDVVIERKTLEQREDMLHLEIDFTIRGIAMEKCQSCTFIPELSTTDGEFVKLFPFVLVNGKNKRQMYERHLRFADAEWFERQPYKVVNVDENTQELIPYEMDVPYEPWMDTAQLLVRQVITSCNEQKQIFTTNISGCMKVDTKAPYVPDVQLTYIVPEKKKKNISVQGSANLDFRVNKTDIDPNYMRNPAELAKIRQTVDEVRNNQDVSMTGLYIDGTASPEGSYVNNTRLSQGRSEALKNYLRDYYHLDESMFGVTSEPENWEGFREEVEADNNLPYRDQILALIDGPDAPDVKEAKLKRIGGGAPYRTIAATILPKLRVVKYRVDYDVKDFSDLTPAELAKKNPKDLNLFEFYTLANYYGKGTKEYNDTYEKMLAQFADDVEANLNGAAWCLEQGDNNAAGRCLEKVGADTRALNNWGVYYMQTGDYDKAAESLNKAAAMGVEEATHNLQELQNKIKDNERLERMKKIAESRD